MAVSRSSHARSAGEYCCVERLKAFHNIPYAHEARSIGKLLSSMQRFGPNSWMQASKYGRMAAASSSEPGGAGRLCQSKPADVIVRPPSLMLIFGQRATAVRLLRQSLNRS